MPVLPRGCCELYDDILLRWSPGVGLIKVVGRVRRDQIVDNMVKLVRWWWWWR